MTKNAVKRKNSKQTDNTTTSEGNPKLRYGPLPRFPQQHVWSRGIIVIGIVIYIWYFSNAPKEVVLAGYKDIVENRGQLLECDPQYLKDISRYSGCASKKCGRYVTDKLVSASEAATLVQLAKQGLALGGSSGGASILDLHSGALSMGEQFINIKSLDESNKIFTPENMAIYKLVKERIHQAVAELFNVDRDSLYLTSPTFFSRLNNIDAKMKHDEYWHPHVDKETYESFHFTSLLYLSDYGVDFKGGRFIFQDIANDVSKNTTVEPRLGRVSMFSSGAENLHYVERVQSGTRYALTVSFTCDERHSIALPSTHK